MAGLLFLAVAAAQRLGDRFSALAASGPVLAYDPCGMHGARSPSHRAAQAQASGVRDD